MDRDCDRCVYARPYGGEHDNRCTAWECEFIPREDAIEAWKRRTDRPQGEWIVKENHGTGWYRITCSECGEDVTATAPCIGFMPIIKVLWNYCPECGAAMLQTERSDDD